MDGPSLIMLLPLRSILWWSGWSSILDLPMRAIKSGIPYELTVIKWFLMKRRKGKRRIMRKDLRGRESDWMHFSILSTKEREQHKDWTSLVANKRRNYYFVYFRIIR